LRFLAEDAKQMNDFGSHIHLNEMASNKEKEIQTFVKAIKLQIVGRIMKPK
jgi:hypothetical protein